MKRTSKAGFTLIEITIAIIILGMLYVAGGLISKAFGGNAKVSVVANSSVVKTVMNAVNQYYSSHTNLEDLDNSTLNGLADNHHKAKDGSWIYIEINGKSVVRYKLKTTDDDSNRFAILVDSSFATTSYDYLKLKSDMTTETITIDDAQGIARKESWSLDRTLSFETQIIQGFENQMTETEQEKMYYDKTATDLATDLDTNKDGTDADGDGIVGINGILVK